jgi:hypothetical protein
MNNINVFIPELKRKFGKKDLARGLWVNESGKVYYDYLRVNTWNLSIKDNYGLNTFFNYLDNLKNNPLNPQECIFYKIGNVGYIYYSRDKIVILPSRIYTEVKKESLKALIKESLKKYSGLTIYQENKKYYIEIFRGL